MTSEHGLSWSEIHRFEEWNCSIRESRNPLMRVRSRPGKATIRVRHSNSFRVLRPWLALSVHVACGDTKLYTGGIAYEDVGAWNA